MNNTDIITDIILIDDKEKKQSEFKNIIDNIDDLRRFLNKGKLQEKFFYKIGDDESFERVTADFFIYCEDKSIQLRKNTVEARFLAYLKPKWETDQDRKNMIEAIERKKIKYIDPVEEMQKKEKEEYERNIIIAKKIESGLSKEEKEKYLGEARERVCKMFPTAKENFIKNFSIGLYYKEILKKNDLIGK